MAADVKDATMLWRIVSGCRIVDCSDWDYLGVFVKNAGVFFYLWFDFLGAVI